MKVSQNMRLFDKKTGNLVVMFFGKPIDEQIDTATALDVESFVRYNCIKQDNMKTAIDFIRYMSAVIRKIGERGGRMIEATLAQMLDPEGFDESDYLFHISEEGDLFHGSIADKLSIQMVEKDSNPTCRSEAVFYHKSDAKITSVQAQDNKVCLLFSVFAFLKFIQTAFSGADLKEIQFHIKAMLSLEFGISIP